MRIVVCVKHVPDPQSDRGFTAEGRVERDPDEGTLNEPDEYAIEAAAALAGPDGEVVVLTMGPPQSRDAVRRGLQRGAHRAVVVTDPALEGSDAFSTATVLAAAVRRIGQDGPVDLVLTGVSSLDGVTAVLPTLLAAELDVAHLGLAADVEVDADDVRVRRDADGRSQVLAAPLPAVVSVTDRANQPRYPDVAGIVGARSKPLTTWSLADLDVDPRRVGRAGARTRVLRAAARGSRDRVLLTDDGTAGTRLATYLLENGLIR